MIRGCKGCNQRQQRHQHHHHCRRPSHEFNYIKNFTIKIQRSYLWKGRSLSSMLLLCSWRFFFCEFYPQIWWKIFTEKSELMSHLTISITVRNLTSPLWLGLFSSLYVFIFQFFRFFIFVLFFSSFSFEGIAL